MPIPMPESRPCLHPFAHLRWRPKLSHTDASSENLVDFAEGRELRVPFEQRPRWLLDNPPYAERRVHKHQEN